MNAGKIQHPGLARLETARGQTTGKQGLLQRLNLVGSEHGLDMWVLLPVIVAATAGVRLCLPFSEPVTTPTVIGPFTLALMLLLLIGFAWGLSWLGERDLQPGIPNWEIAARLVSCFAAVAMGLLAVEVRVLAFADTRPIASETRPVALEGWVLGSQNGENGTRYLVRLAALEGFPPESTPQKARLTDRAGTSIAPGRAVRCLAILHPPGSAQAPRRDDAARRSYFEGVGAVGFSLGPCRAIALGDPSGIWDRAELGLARFRREIAERAVQAWPTPGGELASGMLSGDRGMLAVETSEALRSAGLTHLLAVSGMNLALIMGLANMMVVWALRLVPDAPGRWPIRHIGACVSMAAGVAYAVVTGLTVPTQRAVIMGAVFWAGHLMNRSGISTRSLAVSLLIVVLIAPEQTLEAGFQMSFAATAALVLAFEAWRTRQHKDPVPPGPLRKMLAGTAGFAATAIAAGSATAPLAASHFQTIASFGILANILASPVIALLATPATGLSAIMALLGWPEPGLAAMGASLDLVVRIGAYVQTIPEAIRIAGPGPPELLGLYLVLVGLMTAGLGIVRLVFVAAASIVGWNLCWTPLPLAILTADGGAYVQETPSLWRVVSKADGLPPLPFGTELATCRRGCGEAVLLGEEVSWQIRRIQSGSGSEVRTVGYELVAGAPRSRESEQQIGPDEPVADIKSELRTVELAAPMGGSKPSLGDFCRLKVVADYFITSAELNRCGGLIITAKGPGLHLEGAPHGRAPSPWRNVASSPHPQ